MLRCAKCQRRRPLKKLYVLASEHWCDNGRACTAVWYAGVRRLQARYRGNHDFASERAAVKESRGRFIYASTP